MIVIVVMIDAMNQFLAFAVSQKGEMGRALHGAESGRDCGPEG